MKDVVVLLPGILGSALAKDGRDIWDLGAGAVNRALFSAGQSIKKLTLRSASSTGDGVQATRLLPDAQVVPFFWKIDGYAQLSHYIESRWELTPGENFFEFPYDWRLDNSICADRLASAAMNWLEQRRCVHPDARLILIGHSMGGLVARYFLEVLGGWRHTKTLITLGTPYRGSVKALDFLVNGWRKSIGPVTLLDLSHMLASFPSVYQLLPIYPCVGENEHDLQSLEKLDRDRLGNLDLALARAGVEFHRQIERAVQANQGQEGYGYRIVPIVGTFQPTFLSAVLTEEGVTSLQTYKGETMLYGDGTVPRLSATPIELSKTKIETFVACPHASLQNFEPARVHMRATLQDVDISELMAQKPEGISLHMDDAFAAGEAVRARAFCDGVLKPMQATLQNLDTLTTIEYELKPTGRAGWQELDAGALPEGAYRVHLDAGDVADPIEDLFIVAHGA